MIVVTVGTNEARFDRLLRAFDAYPGGERFGHFAFDVQDLDTAYADLVAAGANEVGRAPAPLEGEGPRIAFVADPDGNWIELIER